MSDQTSFSRLTLRLILTLIIAAIFTTTPLVLLFAPSQPVSSSNLPAIQSSWQADYRAESVPPVFAPLRLPDFNIHPAVKHFYLLLISLQ